MKLVNRSTQCNQQPSDYPHHFHSEEKKEENPAWETIHEFFDYYGLDCAEEYLWKLILAAIGSDDFDEDGLARHNLLDFYYQVRSLFKMTYLLHLEKGRED